MLVRTLFFAFPALAIATSGHAQGPATSEPSAPPAKPALIRSSRKLVSTQSVASAKTPVGTPSESPSPPATVAPPQRNAGPAGQPVPDQDTVSRLQIFLDEHSFGPGKIDGRWGEFIGKALQRFQAAHGQQPSGQIDSALQQELQKISPLTR
jgi:Putative peptidoglycan binding domain